MSIKIASILAFANKTNDEFDSLFSSASEASEALKMALESEREDNLKELGQQLKTIVQHYKGAVERQVAEIRNYRKAERHSKQTLSDIERAWAYGTETNNFFPLCILLGLTNKYSADNVISQVPSTWQPKKNTVVASE